MPSEPTQPTRKPRGRNGGRRPTIDPAGGKAVPVNISLPTWAIAVLDAAGTTRAAAGRDLLLPAIRSAARARNLPTR